MSLLSLLSLASLFPSATLARTVSVPTYVCNPGAVVRVPVHLDDAAGCACVDVQLAYDAQVLVPVSVEPGTLAAAFAEDLTTDSETPGVVGAGLYAAGDCAAVSGTIAVVTFRVREGTAGLFSDLTVMTLTLGKANGLDAESPDSPTKVEHGMIRVMAETASVERLEKAETVCAGTALGQLTLSPGDGLAADGLAPVVVSGTVSTEGAIPVAPPTNGWRTAEYRLLTTQSAGLSFSLQGLSAEDGYELTSVTEAGLTTYTAAVTVHVAAIVPGELIEKTTAEEAADYMAQINGDPVLKAELLKAPEESAVGAELTDYRSRFAAVALGRKIAFVLNEEGTNAVVAAQEKVSTNVLATVLASPGASAVTVDRPLKGFYYSLRQGGAVSSLGFAQEADKNKLGGRDTITFGLTKPEKAGFYQILVTPSEVK